MKKRSLSRREIATFLSRIENREPAAKKQLKPFFSAQSFSKSICFTGPAGVGKSSLISKLLQLRTKEKKVAWLACDPSSLHSGGSILGDRIRLGGQELSEGSFIRSLSTRSTQAFSPAVRDMEVFLENFFDEVWVETAGAGQTQQEVTQISGLSVLVLQPETGDEIQWMKSGVRELADIFVVHKSDLKGADLMMQSLIENGVPKDRCLLASSQSGEGVAYLLSLIDHIRSEFSWKNRLSELHLCHARDLYIEHALIKVEKAFRKVHKKWMKNPY